MPEDERPGEEDFDFEAPQTGDRSKLEVEPGGLNIETLPERFGFMENETAKALRQQLIELMTTSASQDKQAEAYNAWRDAAEKKPDDSASVSPEVRVGLNISQTLIFKEANLRGMYFEELAKIIGDFQEYPASQNLNEVINTLEIEIRDQIEALPKELRFAETPEMFQIRTQLTEQMINGSVEATSELFLKYADLVDEINYYLDQENSKT